MESPSILLRCSTNILNLLEFFPDWVFASHFAAVFCTVVFLQQIVYVAY
ncbi:MAG: hypothetical protein RLZZ502_290 [Pseudomonadota bacterium]